MIILYYTNAPSIGTEQKEPKKSLGGNISSTTIPNGRNGSIFGNVGAIDLQQGGKKIIAIAAKNIAPNALTSLTFSANADFNHPNIKYKFAFVTMDDGVMEQVAHFEDIPYIGDFMQLGLDFQNNETISLSPTLGAGESIGIWIQRVIEPSDSPDCDLSEDFEENINLTFGWT